MEAKARVRNLRVSPRKLRLLANLVRGKLVSQAVDSLRFCDQKMSGEVLGVIRSAMNNATQLNRSADVDKLYVKSIMVDGAPTIKRFMTRARGSASGILKRMSHLTVVVDEKK